MPGSRIAFSGYRLVRASVAVGTMLITGCHGDCTLIGCLSGITVSFSSRPTEAYRLEARGIGSAEVVMIECRDIGRCVTAPLLQNFLPQRAAITVTYQGRTTTTEVSPKYGEVFPNGKGCGGGCQHAAVTVTLP